MTDLEVLEPVSLTEAERADLVGSSQDLRLKILLRVTLLLGTTFFCVLAPIFLFRLLCLGLFSIELGAIIRAYRRYREIQVFLEGRAIPIWHETAGRLLLLKPCKGQEIWVGMAPQSDQWWTLRRFFPMRGRGKTALEALDNVLRKMKLSKALPKET